MSKARDARGIFGVVRDEQRDETLKFVEAARRSTPQKAPNEQAENKKG